MIEIHPDAADVTSAGFNVKDARTVEWLPSREVRTRVELSVFVSVIDGAIVLQIDTPPDIGRFRINVNEGTVFDADPETGRI